MMIRRPASENLGSGSEDQKSKNEFFILLFAHLALTLQLQK